MKRLSAARVAAFLLLSLFTLVASAALTPAQLTTLRTNILNSVDPEVIAARDIRNDNELARLYNLPSAFIVFKTSVQTMDIGKTINYVAYEAMTAGNISKLEGFIRLNPSSFLPTRSDIRAFFQNVFSGALGGEGQNTRDAMEALYRRAALRIEQLFATGTGTTLSPGTLVYEGGVTVTEISTALNQ